VNDAADEHRISRFGQLSHEGDEMSRVEVSEFRKFIMLPLA